MKNYYKFDDQANDGEYCRVVIAASYRLFDLQVDTVYFRNIEMSQM